MCLAVPLKILRLLPGSKAVVALGQGGPKAGAAKEGHEPAQGSGELQVDVSLIEDPAVGDHVIVHAGYAIEVLSLQEAEERLELFRKMAELGGEA
jgi:hydrogenase expression/formation protein HypC